MHPITTAYAVTTYTITTLETLCAQVAIPARVTQGCERGTQAGDVRYVIICTNGDSASGSGGGKGLADRAYHPPGTPGPQMPYKSTRLITW
jgi:hypothetical protein